MSVFLLVNDVRVIALVLCLSTVSRCAPSKLGGPCRSQYSDAGENNGLTIGTGTLTELTRPNEFPWTASLKMQRPGGTGHVCGGSIINERWILTAARCVAGKFPLSVAVGFASSANDVQILDALGVKVYPNYKPSTGENDIALVQLTSSIKMNENVSAICLDSDWRSVPDKTYAGWGVAVRSAWYYPAEKVVQTDGRQFNIKMVLIRRMECTSRLLSSGKFVFPETNFCAIEAHSDRTWNSCQGDYGSPITVKSSDGTFAQVGILTWIKECQTGIPSVFTSVAKYYKWIMTTVGTPWL